MTLLVKTSGKHRSKSVIHIAPPGKDLSYCRLVEIDNHWEALPLDNEIERRNIVAGGALICSHCIHVERFALCPAVPAKKALTPNEKRRLAELRKLEAWKEAVK